MSATLLINLLPMWVPLKEIGSINDTNKVNVTDNHEDPKINDDIYHSWQM